MAKLQCPKCSGLFDDTEQEDFAFVLLKMVITCPHCEETFNWLEAFFVQDDDED